MYFKLKANGFIDTTQLRMIESIDKRLDNQVIDLLKKMPGLYLERQLHSMRYEQISPIKIEEKEFCLRFRCIVTETNSKKTVEAKIMKVDKKKLQPTRGIANKDFRGMRRVVARFNFCVTGKEIARNRQLLIPPSLAVI